MQHSVTDDNKEVFVQYSTFLVGDKLYGIDVTRVQEVVKSLPITEIPLAPGFVKGVMNLRGQVATAIGLKELFRINSHEEGDRMNVVCKYDGHLMSFVIDEIGDVIEVSESRYEQTPQTISEDIRKFLSGVYKLEKGLISIIDVDKVMEFLNSSLGAKAA